ncbi:hypothetical protein [Xanthomonas vesicatoria]|uniref:hypothetical protein n=1 Tax=Xanthomonas vesicatoria TaxID=56460 RepID=UPI001269BE81|nr:hypothetical protein [Xanthomonas vesicatoria]
MTLQTGRRETAGFFMGAACPEWADCRCAVGGSMWRAVGIRGPRSTPGSRCVAPAEEVYPTVADKRGHLHRTKLPDWVSFEVVRITVLQVPVATPAVDALAALALVHACSNFNAEPGCWPQPRVGRLSPKTREQAASHPSGRWITRTLWTKKFTRNLQKQTLFPGVGTRWKQAHWN